MNLMPFFGNRRLGVVSRAEYCYSTSILHILFILFESHSSTYRLTRLAVFRSSTIIPSASTRTS